MPVQRQWYTRSAGGKTCVLWGHGQCVTEFRYMTDWDLRTSHGVVRCERPHSWGGSVTLYPYLAALYSSPRAPETANPLSLALSPKVKAFSEWKGETHVPWRLSVAWVQEPKPGVTRMRPTSWTSISRQRRAGTCNPHGVCNCNPSVFSGRSSRNFRCPFRHLPQGVGVGVTAPSFYRAWTWRPLGLCATRQPLGGGGIFLPPFSSLRYLSNPKE